jgi:hypothetical protein
LNGVGFTPRPPKHKVHRRAKKYIRGRPRGYSENSFLLRSNFIR